MVVLQAAWEACGELLPPGSRAVRGVPQRTCGGASTGHSSACQAAGKGGIWWPLGSLQLRNGKRSSARCSHCSRDLRCGNRDHARGLLPGVGGGVVEQGAEAAGIRKTDHRLCYQRRLAKVEKVQADVRCRYGARRAKTAGMHSSVQHHAGWCPGSASAACCVGPTCSPCRDARATTKDGPVLHRVVCRIAREERVCFASVVCACGGGVCLMGMGVGGGTLVHCWSGLT